MIVLHEELMEEIYDWLGDAEKQADSIAVNEDDISSVMEEYGRHRVWLYIRKASAWKTCFSSILKIPFIEDVPTRSGLSLSVRKQR